MDPRRALREVQAACLALGIDHVTVQIDAPPKHILTAIAMDVAANSSNSSSNSNVDADMAKGTATTFNNIDEDLAK